MPVVFEARSPDYSTLIYITPIEKQEMDAAIDATSEKALFSLPIWKDLFLIPSLYDKSQMLKLVYGLNHITPATDGNVSLDEVMDTMRQFIHLYSLAGESYKNHFFMGARRMDEGNYCLHYRLVDNDNNNLFRGSLFFDTSHEYSLVKQQPIVNASEFLSECHTTDLQTASQLLQQVRYQPDARTESGYLYGIKPEKQSAFHLDSLNSLQKKVLADQPQLAQLWVQYQMQWHRYQDEMESAIRNLLQAYHEGTSTVGEMAQDRTSAMDYLKTTMDMGSKRICCAFKNLTIYRSEIEKEILELIKRDVFAISPHQIHPHSLIGAPLSSLLRTDVAKPKLSTIKPHSKTEPSGKK